MTGDPGMKLLVQDEEDLKILSAAVQDAVAKLGDFRFDPKGRTFTAMLNRYRWETGAGTAERVRSAVRFDGVLTARARNLRLGAKDAVVALLTVTFEAGEAPGGRLRLILAGGGEILLEAECLEARLLDISAPWPARGRPAHGED